MSNSKSKLARVACIVVVVILLITVYHYGFFNRVHLQLLIEDQPLPMTARANYILIIKSERKLFLMNGSDTLKTYFIALGRNPEGHKEQDGDGKTPEGLYFIDWRNHNSRYHLSLHISYPNQEDRERARALGVNPGGDIMIHGLPNGLGAIGKMHRMYDWTLGCIAVTNEEIEEIWRATPDGTPVEIRP